MQSHISYFYPQTGRRQWWSWIFGFSLVIIGWILISSIIYGYIYPWIITHYGTNLTLDYNTDAYEALLVHISRNPYIYMTILMVFPATLICLYVVQLKWHKRPLLYLHTGATYFRYKRLFQALTLTLSAYAITACLSYVSGLGIFRYTFVADRFWPYLLISLLFIPLQSATEEIIFRGYLNQAFCSLMQHKWLAFFLSSLFFTSMHMSNPEIQSAQNQNIWVFIWTLSSYFFFAFLLSILVFLDNGLEAAIGIHIANNMFAAIFINYEGSALPTPSLFMTNLNIWRDPAINMLVLCLIFYFLYRSRSR